MVLDSASASSIAWAKFCLFDKFRREALKSGPLGVSEELDTTLPRCIGSNPCTSRLFPRLSVVWSLLLSCRDTGECDFGRPTPRVLKTSTKLVVEGFCWGAEGASSEDIRLTMAEWGPNQDLVYLYIPGIQVSMLCHATRGAGKAISPLITRKTKQAFHSMRRFEYTVHSGGKGGTLGDTAAKVQSGAGCQSGTRAEQWIERMRKSYRASEDQLIVLPNFRRAKGLATVSQAGGLQKSHLESRGMRLFQPKSPDKAPKISSPP